MQLFWLWVVLLAAPESLPATAAGPVDPAATPAKEDAPGMRLYTQRAFTKIREGSLLMGRVGSPPSVDLRSSSERWRDAERVRHYGRLAQLEALADLARRHRLQHVSDRVDVLVRLQTQHHYQLSLNMPAAPVLGDPAEASPPVDLRLLFRAASDRARRDFHEQSIGTELDALDELIKSEKDAF
jgi:hypothetical protein